MKYEELNTIGEMEQLKDLLEEHNVESHVATEGLIVPIVIPRFMLDVVKNEKGYYEVSMYKLATFVEPSFDWKFRYDEMNHVVLQIKALVECFSEGYDEGKHQQKLKSK